MRNPKITAYHFPNGSIRFFDNDGFEYEEERALGSIKPIQLATIKPFKLNIPDPTVNIGGGVTLPDTTKPGFFKDGGGASKVVDFVSSIFKRKDGTKTFVGEVATELVKQGAQPIASGYPQVQETYVQPNIIRADQTRTSSFPNWAVYALVGATVLGVGYSLLNKKEG